MSKNSLSAAIAGSLKQTPDPISDVVERKKATPKASKPIKATSSRQGTVLIGGHFPPKVKQQLRMLAVEEGKTNQALLEEALDLLFVKKAKKSLSEL